MLRNLYEVPFLRKSIQFWALCITKCKCSTGFIGAEIDFLTNFAVYPNTKASIKSFVWRLCKIAKSDCQLFLCVSVRIEQLGSH
jgi:hypothetical protein